MAAATALTQGFTERVARACVAHRRRTFAAWGLAVVLALVLVATSLHGLTSNGTVTGNPESARADALVYQAFPPTPADLLAQYADVVVVTSPHYTVDEPQFRAFVAGLLKQAQRRARRSPRAAI